MAMRIQRGLAARVITPPAYETLGLWEIYPAEELMKISGQVMAYSESGADLGDVLDVNFYMLYVPYSLWNTYLDDEDDLDNLPTYPDTLADIDNRFEQLMLDDLSGSKYYGGESAEGTKKVGPGGSTTDTDSLNKDVTQSDDPLGGGAVFRGPIGVVRLASAELLVPPWGADGAGSGRHSVSFPLSMNIGISNPGVVVFGVVRHAIPSAGGNENLYNSLALAESAVAGRISALNRLRGGDMHRNRVGVRQGGTTWAVQMQQMLFGSDNNCQAAIWGVKPLRCSFKWAATYSTPYSTLEI